MMQRENSIDVLRGLAIVGMVLSGTISRNPDLPSYLFHAQIAPPEFKFDANLPGITWVDLVFPFFLFAMGMAFPFSLNSLIKKGLSNNAIVKKIFFRTFKLFFFAVMLGQLSPFHFPETLGWIRYLMGIIAFAGFFMAFSKFPAFSEREKSLNALGFLILVGLCFFKTFALEIPFSVHRNDIIILVLANMALFGALIWLFSRKNWHFRIGIVALYFALRLTHQTDDSWNQLLWDFTPFKWLAANFSGFYAIVLSWGIDLKRTVFYHPEYLKYLMIVIPGTIAGDLIYAGNREQLSFSKNKNNHYFYLIPVLLAANLALNLWGLLSRNLDWVWIGNIITILGLFYFKEKANLKHFHNFHLLLLWSIFWLALGIVFEAWEGGIKKDPSTISYFFLTSGLAGFLIIFFKIFDNIFYPEKLLGFISLTGMNPMLGYVVVTYFVLPLLYFVQLLSWIEQWHTFAPWLGFIKGLFLTSLMILLTVWSVKKRYFWKT
jgi:predicted acyltransferase